MTVLRAPLADQAADALLARIRAGEWTLGERLPGETTLAPQLGVGRSTVREAIRQLAGRGVLQSRQGAGVFVTALDVPEDWDAVLRRAGIVSVIGSQAVPQTEIRTGARIVRVRVSVDQIPPKERALLTAGMDVDVSSRTAIAARALLVPADAVLTDSEGPYLFVIEGGAAVKRRVKTGYSTGRETEILSGLKAREQVAVSAKEQLQDGTLVSVQEAS